MELAAKLKEEKKDVLKTHATLMALRPILFTDENSRALSADDCLAIAVSHMLPKPTDALPTLDEMLATGRIDVPQNQVIKADLREFMLHRERARAWHEEGSKDLFRLAHLHPDLLRWRFVPIVESEGVPENSLVSGGGFKATAQCDLTAMKSSPALLNDLFDNLGRLSWAIHYNFEGVEARLQKLQSSLADELGVE